MTDLAKLRIWNDAEIAGAPPTGDLVDGMERFSPGCDRCGRLEERLREVPIASGNDVSRLMRRRGHIEYCYR